MTVLCPGCRRPIRIPADKEATPNLRARCAVCGHVFAVASAERADAPPAAPSVAPLPSTPALQPPRAPAAAPAAPPVAPTPAAAAPAVRPGRGPAPVHWRRCTNHRAVASEGVCTQCGKGFCSECLKRQATAAICPNCDALCVSSAEREEQEARARMRARPLSAELATVLAYPFTDKLAYVALAVFVGLFALAASFAMFGSGLGFFISKGLLYAYAFSAINRVAAGDLRRSFMPELSDWTDLVQPVRAGTAALLISSGPLMLLSFLFVWQDVAARALGPQSARFISAPARPTPEASPTLPPEVQAMLRQDSGPATGADDTAEAAAVEGQPAEAPADREAGAAAAERIRLEMAALAAEPPTVPAWAVLAFLLAIVWQVVYAPIALVAAAISRSFLATLNPLAGLDAIRRMGSVYWTAMGVYTVLVVAASLCGGILSLVPVGGRLLKAFVDSYAYLAIGCLLGFAVYKKAPELHLD